MGKNSKLVEPVMHNPEEALKNRIVRGTNSAMDIVERYLAGKDEIDNTKALMAFRLLNQGVKVLHMNQVKALTERGHALRLLKFLPDDNARSEYIRMTNPQAAPLLLKKPE